MPDTITCPIGPPPATDSQIFTRMGQRKLDDLRQKGFFPVAVSLENRDGERVSVDRYGRVTWQYPSCQDMGNVAQ